jgi:L-threonylcarbamoyladenylate synthase
MPLENSGSPSQTQDPSTPAAPWLRIGIELLRTGGLVAFPTETVYGLGADATNPIAIEKIFKAKGRPATNPLIVHVADVTVARRYTTTWPRVAAQLAERFWPGPLTVVLPKSPVICAAVTSGRHTVGLRVPNHPVALELLQGFDGPLAAPSANRANHISPTTAEHVRADLGDRVDLILDGGPCTVGIESTVIDLSTDRPRILRPGGVTREQIEAVIGPVEVFDGSVDVLQSAASPGQHRRHYSPVTPAFGFGRDQLAHVLQKPGAVVLVIGLGNAITPAPNVIEMPDDPQAYATVLYQTLREIDARRPEAIYILMPPDEPSWTAVRDRLMRATRLLK